MKISKIELEKIFNEQFEDLQEWTEPELQGPGIPPLQLSTEEIAIKALAYYKSEGAETFEQVWEMMASFVSDNDQISLLLP